MPTMSDLRLFAEVIEDELIIPMIRAEEDLHVSFDVVQAYEIRDQSHQWRGSGYVTIIINSNGYKSCLTTNIFYISNM